MTSSFNKQKRVKCPLMTNYFHTLESTTKKGVNLPHLKRIVYTTSVQRYAKIYTVYAKMYTVYAIMYTVTTVCKLYSREFARVYKVYSAGVARVDKMYTIVYKVYLYTYNL